MALAAALARIRPQKSASRAGALGKQLYVWVMRECGTEHRISRPLRRGSGGRPSDQTTFRLDRIGRCFQILIANS